MGSLIQIHGKSLIHDGKPISLRGVNTGNWMLIEHFMIGLPWVEHKIRSRFQEILGEDAYHRFFDTYMAEYLTDDDFRFLQESGFNFIRLPFNYRHFESDDKPGVYLEEGFRLLDRAIDLCRRYGQYVMLDLHAAAGCQARDWNAESEYGEAYLWSHPHFMDRTANLWKAIAARYRGEERVMGYDILNEPVAPDLDVFHRFNMSCINAIRSVDKDHVIIVESNRWGKEIASLRNELFADPQVMPQLHHYHMQFPPFDRLPDYPAHWEGTHYGRAELLDTLKATYDDARIRRPMIAGEFGLHSRFRHADAQLKIFDDLLGIFNQKGWHWTQWSYKDVGVMGLVRPGERTAWKQFQQQPEIRATREEFVKAAQAFTETLGTSVSLVSPEDLSHVQRQVGHVWHEVCLPRVLELLKERHYDKLEELARSFAFRNCEVWQGPHEVLRRRAKESAAM